METKSLFQKLCDWKNDGIKGCTSFAEFKFTDTALNTNHLENGLVKEEITTITLGYSCEEHVEEVKEQLEDAKQRSEKQKKKQIKT